jgi:hypothetical protein
MGFLSAQMKFCIIKTQRAETLFSSPPRFGSNEGVQKSDLLFGFCFTSRHPQVYSDDVYGGSLK